MEAAYDRRAELEAFDAKKEGVKGLVDSGITRIPRMFICPEADRISNSQLDGNWHFKIPVISMKDLDGGRRKEIIENIRLACESWGFFQLEDHCIPIHIMDGVLEGTKRFFEQDSETKKKFYTRDFLSKVRYNSNFDLFTSPSANWRDSFSCSIKAPEPPRYEDLPEVCRDSMVDYMHHTSALGDVLIELLSEALGLEPEHLKNLECTKWSALAAHYYPPCPEPELTMGTSKHSDATFFTILLQDDKGGLQVLYKDSWVDIPPVPGSLIINIGDFLQLMSNDNFKSSEHRVVASRNGPRMSVPTFYSTFFHPTTRMYGPIEELLADDKPARYRDITIKEYYTHYTNKGLDGTSALDFFRKEEEKEQI